ncbi:MAG: hypothetical protein AAGB34_05725 [Planctomycetota bacterium]
MPIVTIQIVQKDPKAIDRQTVQRLADELGEVFSTEPGRVWVRIQSLPHAHYAESTRTESETPSPVFVEVLQSALPGEDELARMAKEIGAVISRGIERDPDLVHVLFLPGASGRIAFGGRLYKGRNQE